MHHRARSAPSTRLGVVALAGLVALTSAGCELLGPLLGLEPGGTPVEVPCEPLPPEALPSIDPIALLPLFDGPSTWRQAEAEVELTPRRLGELELPDGRLVAADPFFIGADALPFERELPVGTYPVAVLEARLPGPDQRVAAAMLRVGDAPVVEAILATVPGADPAGLCPGEILGFGVDAGLGTYTTSTAGTAIAAAQAEDPDALVDAILAAAPPEGERWSGGLVRAPDGSDMAIFPTGWGDGVYPSYWLEDDEGNVVALVTDLGLLGPPAGPAS